LASIRNIHVAMMRHRSHWNELAISAHAWQLHPESIRASFLDRAARDWLEVHERQHLVKLRPVLQHEYLAARALCRLALSYYTNAAPADWRFKTEAHGKPRIAQPRQHASLHFNLTHTDNLIICLVTRIGEVGVDAEALARKVDMGEITKHFFAAAEQKSLAKLPPKDRAKRFFEIWVIKEAYLKARGRGLTISPERVPIRFHSDGAPYPIKNWQLELHSPTLEHVAATAVDVPSRHPPVPIVWRNASELFAQ
jgi:phosphopantetheinyl transferase